MRIERPPFGIHRQGQLLSEIDFEIEVNLKQ
jgi:hypothetical protein